MGEFAKDLNLQLKDVKELINTGVIADAVKIGNNGRKWILRNLAHELYQKHKFKEAGFNSDNQQNGQNFDRLSQGSGERDGSMMVDKKNMGVYSQARAVKETFVAKTAQVKYEQMMGQLVEVDEVRKAAKLIGLNIRNALENLPNKLAPIVTAETDVAENKRILASEIKAALDNLSRGDYDFLKDIDEPEQTDGSEEN